MKRFLIRALLLGNAMVFAAILAHLSGLFDRSAAKHSINETEDEDRMKNAWKSVFVLGLTLICGMALLSAMIALPASAGGESGIDCNEIAGCWGSAGCAFGAPNGCEVECSDGNSFKCNKETVFQ